MKVYYKDCEHPIRGGGWSPEIVVVEDHGGFIEERQVIPGGPVVLPTQEEARAYNRAMAGWVVAHCY